MDETRAIVQSVQSASVSRFNNEILYVIDNGKYADSDGKSRGLYSLYTADCDGDVHFSINTAWNEPFLHCYFGTDDHIACFSESGMAALVIKRRDDDEDKQVQNVTAFDTIVHPVSAESVTKIRRVEPSAHGDRNTIFFISKRQISRMSFSNSGETSSVVHESTANMHVLDISGVAENVVAATVKASNSRKTSMCLFDARMQKSVATEVNSEGSPLSVSCMSHEKNMAVYLEKANAVKTDKRKDDDDAMEEEDEEGAPVETNMFMAGYENGDLAIFDIRMCTKPIIKRRSKANMGIPICSRIWADAAPWYTGMLCDKTGVVVFNNKKKRYTEIGVPIHENRRHEVNVMFRAEHCFVLFPSSMTSKNTYNSLDLFAIPISTL